VFGDNGAATDVSALHQFVQHGAILPQTYRNPAYSDTWTAVFTGSESCFYKVDYRNNTTVKSAFVNAFSMETLYKPRQVGNMTPLSAQDSGGAGIEQSSGGVIQFWAHIGGGYQTLNSSVTVIPGQYYHVVGAYDRVAGRMTIYVNGQRAGNRMVSGSFAFPANVDAHWIGIGGDASTGANAQFPLNGEVVRARMYGKALSLDEVKLLYEKLQ
jgi:hypothetical protein